MPGLKQLSGKDVVKFLEANGFIQKRSKGSHLRMTLEGIDGDYHITIPLHAELRKGTLSGIAKELESVLGKESVEKYFYKE